MVDVLPLHGILRKHVPTGRKIDILNIDIEGWTMRRLLPTTGTTSLPK